MGRDRFEEEDKSGLVPALGVNTVVKAGELGAGDHLDVNVIEVEPNMYTNNVPRQVELKRV